MTDLATLADQAHAAARRYRNAVLGGGCLSEEELEVVEASVELIQAVLEAALLHAERVAPPVEDASES